MLGESDTFSREHGDDVHPYLKLSPPHHGLGRRPPPRPALAGRPRVHPRRIAEQRPALQALTDRLLDTMVADGEPTDIVEALAMPLHAVGEVLQTPEQDRGQFRAWGDMFISTGPNRAFEAETALREMTAYVARGASLYHHLCVNPDAIPGAIHETLRTIPNGTLETAQPRRAMRTVELDGVTIAAGDIVVPASPSRCWCSGTARASASASTWPSSNSRSPSRNSPPASRRCAWPSHPTT
ncbi:hypothetical protein [Actinomadura gamaensis]|uniref:Uncharacterized protein n=1 Tax=Actinomadura gamaensis TaxID=1763541 RepID=A0ABV9U5P2_9ACTN